MSTIPTNHYFNNYLGNKSEQNLVEDLLVESIRIMGTDVFYIPLDNAENRDLLYGEDPTKKFKAAYPVEVYPSNIMEYGGDKEFFSKFGLEIKNQIDVLLSKRTFSQRVPQNRLTRPMEGDLLYVPFLNGLGEVYEIKFVNQNKDHFMLGRKLPYFYELSMEKFKYSQEIVDTGIPDIDIIVDDSAYSHNFILTGGTGNYQYKEIVFQSSDGTYANSYCYATVSSWNAPTKLLSCTNINGSFLSNNSIIGATSGVTYNLVSYDPLSEPAQKEAYDNGLLVSESLDILVEDETNPIGGLGTLGEVSAPPIEPLPIPDNVLDGGVYA